jgi:hypothetical protein
VAPWVAHIRLTCAEEQGPLQVLPIPGTCVQNYTLPTPLACNYSGAHSGARPRAAAAGMAVQLLPLFLVALLALSATQLIQ